MRIKFCDETQRCGELDLSKLHAGDRVRVNKELRRHAGPKGVVVLRADEIGEVLSVGPEWLEVRLQVERHAAGDTFIEQEDLLLDARDLPSVEVLVDSRDPRIGQGRVSQKEETAMELWDLELKLADARMAGVDIFSARAAARHDPSLAGLARVAPPSAWATMVAGLGFQRSAVSIRDVLPLAGRALEVVRGSEADIEDADAVLESLTSAIDDLYYGDLDPSVFGAQSRDKLIRDLEATQRLINPKTWAEYVHDLVGVSGLGQPFADAEPPDLDLIDEGQPAPEPEPEPEPELELEFVTPRVKRKPKSKPKPPKDPVLAPPAMLGEGEAQVPIRWRPTPESKTYWVWAEVGQVVYARSVGSRARIVGFDPPTSLLAEVLGAQDADRVVLDASEVRLHHKVGDTPQPKLVPPEFVARWLKSNRLAPVRQAVMAKPWSPWAGRFTVVAEGAGFDRTAIGPLGVEEMKRWLRMPGEFAVVSASREGRPSPENRYEHGSLMGELQRRGYTPGQIRQLRGQYFGPKIDPKTKKPVLDENGEPIIVMRPEQSYLVLGMGFDEAIELGTQYKQESVIYKSPEGVLGAYYTDGSGRVKLALVNGKPAIGEAAGQVRVREPKEKRHAPPSDKDLWSKARNVSFEFPIDWEKTYHYQDAPLTLEEAEEQAREVTARRASAKPGPNLFWDHDEDHEAGDEAPGRPTPSFRPASPDEFEAGISQVEQSALDAERDYGSGAKLYMSTDGKAGYAVGLDGEMKWVWSTARGYGKAAVTDAIRHGATYGSALDNGKLVQFYSGLGFEEDRREKNWTEGEPDVVHMRLRKGGSDDEDEKAGAGAEYVPPGLGRGASYATFAW